MDYELVALGGAAAAPTCEGEKKPPIGGSAILLKAGEWGLMNDCGAYLSFGKAREDETESIISDYRQIGEYRLPIVDTTRFLRKNDALLPSKSDAILPDFNQLYGIKYLIIVLGHGHHDHVAGYPVLRKMLAGKGIKPIILATKDTFGLAKWLWFDQLKQMIGKGQKPGYDEAMLRQICKEFQLIGPGQRTCLGPFTLSFLHAGHILGAVSTLVSINSTNQKVLITSDLSFTDQHTVKGAPKYNANDFGGLDYLITEFTYGERDVKDRREEIRRMTRDIIRTLKAGGKVLLTALAIGRSSEVFRILEEAGITRQWKVYIAGSAITTAIAYEHSGALKPTVKKHFARNRYTHYSIMNDFGPCVVIAPAGMMTGGWAVDYAKEWADNPKNLIAFTCFQAKDTPGRRMLSLQKNSPVRLGGKDVVLRAEIKQYKLSAHASGKEIREMIERLAPKQTFLVHGEEEQIDRFVGSSGINAKKMIVGKRYTI